MLNKYKWNKDSAIRGALRRTFSRSPVIRQMMQKVRREVPKFKKDGSLSKKNAVQYLCNVCKQYVGSTLISVDHIVPVIDKEGFLNWETFINRLFCDETNLQVICDQCHLLKTNQERNIRQTLKDQIDLKELSSRPLLLTEKEQARLKRLRKKIQNEQK